MAEFLVAEPFEGGGGGTITIPAGHSNYAIAVEVVSDSAPSTVTCQGTSMGTARAVVTDFFGVQQRIYVLANPGTGARTIAVTGGGTQYLVRAIAARDVDQADPFRGTPVHDGDSGSFPTIDVTTAVGDLVIDFAAVDTTGSLTPVVGQTERIDLTLFATYRAASSTKAGAAGTTSMGWTPGGTPNCYNTVAVFRSAGGTVYTLECDPGSLALTGTPASLNAGRVLGAQAGALALTGQPATLRRERHLDALAGTVALTGSQAQLRRQAQLGALSGAVALTGTAAALTHDRRLEAEAGALTLTGLPVDLQRAWTLEAQPGALTLTGQQAALNRHALLQALGGTLALTGQSASLDVRRALLALPGALALTGAPVQLRLLRQLLAQAAAVTLLGQDATLTLVPAPGTNVLVCEPGVVSLAGQSAELVHTRRLAALAGAVSLSGPAAALHHDRVLLADGGTLTLAGTAATLRLARELLAQAGALSISGHPATLTWDGLVIAVPSALPPRAVLERVRATARLERPAAGARFERAPATGIPEPQS